MSLAYLILCAHTADKKRQWLSVCYCREIPSLAPLFSPFSAVSPKQLKLDILNLKEIFSMIEVILFFFFLYTSLFLYLRVFQRLYAYICISSFIIVVFNVKCFEMNSYSYNTVPMQQRLPILVCNSIKSSFIVCLMQQSRSGFGLAWS